nr:nucleotidyl transferase AbiEii/AbiGii toxin family protein [Microvirga puerhi]
MVNAGIERREWVWGGGTMLMLRYGHRSSRDIDLFLNDLQHLSLLTPRLHDRHLHGLRDYVESPNHLRLELAAGEIDFLLVAPVFPDLKPLEMTLPGVIEGPFLAMPDKEILGQKLHYRAAGFKGRDLYDFSAVMHASPMLKHDEGLRTVAMAKRAALQHSVSTDLCRLGFEQVQDRSLSISFEEARADFLDWLDRGGPAPTRSPEPGL